MNPKTPEKAPKIKYSPQAIRYEHWHCMGSDGPALISKGPQPTNPHTEEPNRI